MSARARVFLVDDHEVVRRGVAGLLSAEFDVVGEAATAAEARARIAATRPDVAVLDVHLPDGSGIDLCRDILSLYPDTHCVILTAFDDDAALAAAVLAGAAGYVLKDVRGSGLIDAVKRAAAGESLIEPRLAQRVVRTMQARVSTASPLDMLTARERDVLAMIAEGLTNRQIGVRLSIAEKTVKNNVSGLLGKLGLERRTQAAAVLFESRDLRP